MTKNHEIDSALFFSKAKYSPFDKISVKGKLISTFSRGQKIIENNEILAKPGTGNLIRY